MTFFRSSSVNSNFFLLLPHIPIGGALYDQVSQEFPTSPCNYFSIDALHHLSIRRHNDILLLPYLYSSLLICFLNTILGENIKLYWKFLNNLLLTINQIFNDTSH